VSIHNLAFVLGLMAEARSTIAAGTFEGLRSRTAAVWGP
jgi:queuine/archaeosine tRNA-ribosyltransferase